MVPHVKAAKRGLEGGRTSPLSCKNTMEVQGDLEGRIQPRTAPALGGC